MIARSILRVLGLICVVGCSGSRPLVATPNLYADGRGTAIFEDIPEALRTPEFEVLYVTDRAVSQAGDNGPRYGQGRSPFLAYGSVRLNLVPAISWETLVAESVTQDRQGSYQLRTDVVEELGRLQSITEQFAWKDGRFYLPPEAIDTRAREEKAFVRQVEMRLEKMQHEDVYLYVHGFANSFDDAVYRMAFLWHFMGRTGVPIAYTWPAGYGGPFGYFHDRESGEYTVLHLKRTLTALARSSRVQRIHIIAHSRGTDVVTTALRELNIASLARRADPRAEWKIQTLVLCSPDMDAQVFSQRVFGENLLSLPTRIVIYYSPRDTALAAANWLFRGRRRLGQIRLGDFTPEAREKLKRIGHIEFIQCNVSGFSTSHDYAFAHPAVLSDMILLLRDRRAAGTENGRPLDGSIEGVWQLNNDYPKLPPGPECHRCP